MADIENGTQFSDLPSSLVINILLRLPMKTLLICRYVRKDWTRLYFSDPYFIQRQLETSNIQFLHRDPIQERKLRFGCIVDEVSTGNLRLETLELSCKLAHHPKYEKHVLNSCNGLLFFIEIRKYGTDPCSIVYVCNPILGEWVSIRLPSRKGFCVCALGFSAKNNQYKILSHDEECGWGIYTLGSRQWRSIETEENFVPWDLSHLDFNTSINGSLHWIRRMDDGENVVQAFNFETERFTVFSLPKVEGSSIKFLTSEALGVINGCLWVSFRSSYDPCSDAEMWAMKEYGDEKSWTMMLALRNDFSYLTQGDLSNEELRARYKELVIYAGGLSHHHLLYTLNGEELVIYKDEVSFHHGVVSYNITRGNRRRALVLTEDEYFGIVAYNPSFVSLHGRGEEVIRGRDTYEGWIKKRLKKETKEKLKKNKKKKLKKMTMKNVKRVWF